MRPVQKVCTVPAKKNAPDKKNASILQPIFTYDQKKLYFLDKRHFSSFMNALLVSKEKKEKLYF